MSCSKRAQAQRAEQTPNRAERRRRRSYEEFSRAHLKWLFEAKEMIEIYAKKQWSYPPTLASILPRFMANAFSDLCDRHMLSKTELTPQAVNDEMHNRIILLEVWPVAVKEVCQWMIDCCRQQVVKPMADEKVDTLVKAVLLREAASALEIKPLERQLLVRFFALLEAEIRIADVCDLYEADADPGQRQTVAREVARRIGNHASMKNFDFDAWDVLAAQRPDFKSDLDAALAASNIDMDKVRQEVRAMKEAAAASVAS